MYPNRENDRAAITPEQAKAFKARWQAVALIEAQEEQSATVKLRWQQLNAIIRLAKALQLPLSMSDEETAIVRKRWASLKAGMSEHDAG